MSRTADLSLSREACADFGRASGYEWLVTNGLGGFACGTVSGACTRRYHGVLVASLQPPVARMVLLAKCELVVTYRGVRYELGANEYADGTQHPQGFRHLLGFRIVDGIPEWTWSVSDLTLRQRIWMVHGENASCVALDVLEAAAPVAVELHPLCALRDYHSHTHAGASPEVTPSADGCRVRIGSDLPELELAMPGGRFESAPDWHYAILHRIERERGLDDREDLFRPGVFHARPAVGERAVLCASVGAGTVPHEERCASARYAAVQAAVPGPAPDWIRTLVVAADQFIVRRGDGGASIIAGYPWFTDWGRDTMIALPGLTLACGRSDLARNILLTYADHLCDGLLPNRFPDAGEAPEYNTVDATLWYVHALGVYFESTADTTTLRHLYPVMLGILAKHVEGTRYGIGVDARDGLLAAGVDGVQLTWMDARVGARVITPRQGKPVEINALWSRALELVASFARHLGDKPTARRLGDEAARHAEAFRQRFWHAQGGHLHDVIDTPDGGDDSSLRPNQIFAVSLSSKLLTPDMQRAVVDTCRRELWTPHGLRSLAPLHPDYQGSYTGGPEQRDAVYHQGTVWAWLLGPLARAHYQVYRNPAAALALLEGLAGHLRHAALGTLGEIFDGDAPNHARGCFAQAWSVGEVLAAWMNITRAMNHPASKGEPA